MAWEKKLKGPPESPADEYRRAVNEALRDIRTNRRVTKVDWSLPTVDLVPILQPRMGKNTTFRPVHFAEYCRRLDAAVDGGHKTVFAAPPQHGKTECVKTAIAKWLVTHPHRRFGYATYGQERAEKISQQVRRLLEGAGIEVKGDRKDWYLPDFNTGMIWRGRGAKVTGEPIDGAFVIDDILSGIEEARSARARQAGFEWYEEDVLRRVHDGASLFVMATRWWDDDLSGRLIDPEGQYQYEYLNFEALCDHPDKDPVGRKLDEPLCPELHSKQELEDIREVSPSTFSSQYQGAPRREQDKVFSDPTLYDELPKGGYKLGYGVDLAYTAKTSSDWSILLQGKAYGDKLYLTNCRRERMTQDEFLKVMTDAFTDEPGPMLFYGSTTEVGQARIISAYHIDEFRAILASADKFVRAQPASLAWKKERILVPSRKSPEYGPWVKPFLKVVTKFRGIGDAEDDDVDALAALHDLTLGGIAQMTGKYHAARSPRADAQRLAVRNAARAALQKSKSGFQSSGRSARSGR